MFPAICIKHQSTVIYSKYGVLLHRERFNCYEEIIGIYTKRYKQLKKKGIIK